MAIRDLKIGIAWDVNTRDLRRANDQTEEYSESIKESQQDVQGLEKQISNSGQTINKEMGRIGTSAGDVESDIESAGDNIRRDFERSTGIVDQFGNAIESIEDPHIDSTQAERQLGNVEQAAEQADAQVQQGAAASVDGSQAERRLGSVESSAQQADAEVNKESQANVDTSQANRKLDDLKEKAQEVSTLMGGVAGGASGAAMFQDLQSFEQLPREFQAQLGVDESTAEELKDQVAGIWSDIPDMTQESSAQAVSSVVRQFDATGERAGELGKTVALLNQQTGSDFSEIARNASLMKDRFDDVESSGQAFDMLYGASQKLSTEAFGELIDNMDEFGVNIGDAGLSGEDLFAAMVQGGEDSTRVMDKLGDSLNSEMIPNIRTGEEATMDMLEELGNSEEQANDWRDAIVEGGDDGNEAIKEILGSLSDLEDENQAVTGGTLLGEIYREQASEINPILDDLSGDIEGIGEDAEEMERRNEGALNGLRRKWRETVNAVDGYTNGMASSVTSTLGNVIPSAITGFVAGGGIGKLIGAFRNSNSWVRRSMGLLGRWGSRIFGLSNPIGWISALVIDMGITFMNSWDQISESAGTAETAVGGFFRGMWESVNVFGNRIIDIINGIITANNKLMSWMPDWLRGPLPETMPKITHEFETNFSDNSSGGSSPTLSGLGDSGGPNYTDVTPRLDAQMATGGEVKGNSHTIAEIGEKSHDEAVLPLTERVYRRMGEGIKSATTSKSESGQQPSSQPIQYMPHVEVKAYGRATEYDKRTFKQWVFETLDEHYENLRMINPMPTER